MVDVDMMEAPMHPLSMYNDREMNAKVSIIRSISISLYLSFVCVHYVILRKKSHYSS